MEQVCVSKKLTIVSALILFSCVHAVLSDEREKGREKLIADRFWEILVKSPRRGATFDRVYGYYVDSGFTDLLQEKCEQRLKQAGPGPDSARAHLLLGLFFERRGRFERAATQFEQAAKEDPQNALAPFYLAGQEITLERPEKAVTALEESFRRQPSRAEVRDILSTLARTALRIGDHEKAVAAWDRLERIFPEDPTIPLQAAESFMSQGGEQEALRRFEQLAGRENADQAARARAGLAAAAIKIRRGEHQAALSDLRRLLDRLSPRSRPAVSVRERIEQLLEQDGDDQALLRWYRQCLDRDRSDIETLKKLVATLQRPGRKDEIRKILLDLSGGSDARATKEEVRFRSLCADLLAESGFLREALESYAALDRSGPLEDESVIRWGKLVLRNNKASTAEAVDIWKRLLRKAPEDSALIARVAELAAEHGCNDQAEEFYRSAIRLDPDEAAYRQQLGLLYHRLHRSDEAIAAFRSFAEGPRKSPDNLLQAGLWLQKDGYLENAADLFREAVGTDPNNVDAILHLAETRRRLLDPVGAIRELARFDRASVPDETFDGALQREIRQFRDTPGFEKLLEALENFVNENKPSARMLWRLAAYRRAAGNVSGAVEAIERAVATMRERNEPSPRLLQAAADLYEQREDSDRAIEIYRGLVRSEGVWQEQALRRLVDLLLRAGQTDAAVEAGKTLSRLGAGNAANMRYYAEVLLEADRKDEAVDLLHQALRAEPGETRTLGLLESALAGKERFDEALEIAWRRLEQAESVEEKLDRIPSLLEYAKAAHRLDALYARLRRFRETVPKRDGALLMARAYRLADRPGAARKELDALLRDRDVFQDDLLLLRESVSLAVTLRDFDEAVRLQETLCRVTKNEEDADRLFVLFDQAGNRERMRALFMDLILRKSALADRLDLIDRMIRREEYQAVDQALSFFEIHERPHWEISYRRIALDVYERLGEMEEPVRVFRDRKVPEREYRSVLPKTPDAEPDPWRLPGLPEGSEDANGPGLSQEELLRQRDFLRTLFRDRLVIESDRSPVEPAKPFLAPATFREARFFALGWLLKSALDEGVQWYEYELARLRTELPRDSTDPEIVYERIRLDRLLADLRDMTATENPPSE